MTGTFPAFGDVLGDRVEALGVAQGLELSARLLQPLASVTRTTGLMERYGPLFVGSSADPMGVGLFDVQAAAVETVEIDTMTITTTTAPAPDAVKGYYLVHNATWGGVTFDAWESTTHGEDAPWLWTSRLSGHVVAYGWDGALDLEEAIQDHKDGTTKDFQNFLAAYVVDGYEGRGYIVPTA